MKENVLIFEKDTGGTGREWFVCLSVCVCVREREREKERTKKL